MHKKLFGVASGVLALLASAAPVAAQTYRYNDLSDSTAAGLSAAFGGAWLLIWCCAIIVGIGIQIAIIMWVYRDAKKLGVPNPELWLVICFISSLLGLIIYYFVVRPDYIAAQASKGEHHSTDKGEHHS